MAKALLTATGIEKSYGKTSVLNGIDFSINQGEVVAIMGPSGSGKSTLLHGLAGIIKIDNGQIVYNGNRVDTYNDTKATLLRRREYGFVFQFGQLVPELSAIDNVALVPLLNGTPRNHAYAAAKELLREVGLAKKLYRLTPGQLSGGQMQRVAIARALAGSPKLLFADEPTGSLDSLNSQKVMDIFVTLAKKHNVAIVMVTHEPSIAAYADREIIVRDGKVSG